MGWENLLATCFHHYSLKIRFWKDNFSWQCFWKISWTLECLSEHWIYTNNCKHYGKLGQVIWADYPSHIFVINSKHSQSLTSSILYFILLSSVQIFFFKLPLFIESPQKEKKIQKTGITTKKSSKGYHSYFKW